MKTRLLWLGCLAWVALAQAAPEPGVRSLVEWNFDRAGDVEGWQANGDLRFVTVSNGVLSAQAVGGDPLFEYRPRLALAAAPGQFFEVRLKADHDGEAELFWSNTSEGRYGGFSQEKTTRFNVQGDRQWHTYRIWPFWHSEGRIVRLRFDVYDGTHFDVDFMRVGEVVVRELRAYAPSAVL